MNHPVKFEHIENKVIDLRNQKVILDSDVAVLYGVETKDLLLKDEMWKGKDEMWKMKFERKKKKNNLPLLKCESWNVKVEKEKKWIIL